MSDSVQPHRRQPTRLPCPLDSPDKNTGVGCHVFLQCMKVKSEIEVAQSCPTLSDPMDCSLPGSSVHGIFQARVLEWIGTAFSKKMLTTWKESDDQTRQHLKSRDVTLPTKICLVKATVYPCVMYGCESWTIKKVDRQRFYAFELWRSNHSILKEIKPEYTLEGQI